MEPFGFWAVRKLGICLADLARRLGMSLQGVGYAVQRGEAIAHENIYQSTRYVTYLFKALTIIPADIRHEAAYP